MNRKKLVILSITGIVTIVLAVLGITYGYYSSYIIGNTNRNSIYVTSVTSTLLYEGLNVDEGENKFSELKCKNRGRFACVAGRILWNSFTFRKDINQNLISGKPREPLKV